MKYRIVEDGGCWKIQRLKFHKNIAFWSKKDTIEEIWSDVEDKTKSPSYEFVPDCWVARYPNLVFLFRSDVAKGMKEHGENIK